MQKHYATFPLMRSLFLLIFSISTTLPLSAQLTTLSGTLEDAETHEPMSNVDVQLRGTDFKTTTSAEGFFDFEVEGLGLFELVFIQNGQQIGSKPISLSDETPNQALGIIEINLSGSTTSQQDIADPIPTITIGLDDGQGSDEPEGACAVP